MTVPKYTMQFSKNKSTFDQSDGTVGWFHDLSHRDLWFHTFLTPTQNQELGSLWCIKKNPQPFWGSGLELVWCACPESQTHYQLSRARLSSLLWRILSWFTLCLYAPSLQFSYFAGLAYKGLKQMCCIQSVVAITVTPGFNEETECITICMPRSSFIHIETL